RAGGGKTAGGRRQGVVVALPVDGQVAEGGDAVDGRLRQRPAQGPLARRRVQGQGDRDAVAGGPARGVQHLHGHGGKGLALRGAGGLLGEAQAGRHGRGDGERRRGRPCQAVSGGHEGVAAAGLVQGHVSEGGDAV